MTERLGQSDRKFKGVGHESAEDLSLTEVSFTSLHSLSDAVVEEIIAQEIRKEVLQDKLDDLVKPRGLNAIAAAADSTVDQARSAWEIDTFGKSLTKVTIGDLVLGLQSKNTETRRACAEALKEESKSDLRLLEQQLRAATLDKDLRTAHYAQVCLDKAEVAVLVVPKI